MSMLPTMKVIVCGEGKTKQKVGYEHDINKLVAKYKKTGQMPRLSYDGNSLLEEGQVIDLTSVGDYQECQTRLARAGELFDRYPLKIRRRFNNDVTEFVKFMEGVKKEGGGNNMEAYALGILERVDVKDNKPNDKPGDTTVNKDDKKGNDDKNK